LDIPLPSPYQQSKNAYAPDPLTLLTYLATAILKVSSLSQTLEKKRARDRSRPEPGFGLHEEREGVIFGLHKTSGSGNGDGNLEEAGVVVEIEVRRRSGRGIKEKLFLSTATIQRNAKQLGVGKASLSQAKICLLDDHPLYASSALELQQESSLEETTFSLGLTDKQRRDREGIVLPYFDAQSGDGAGDGGRILYEMDRVDDFDEEEDEL